MSHSKVDQPAQYEEIIIRIEIIGDYLILTVKDDQPQDEFKEVYKR